MAFATTSRPRGAKVKGLLGLAVALSFGLAITGCSAAEDGKGNEGSATKQLNIVATTNVYGDIASSVAGEHSKVSSIISNAAQEPHSYEATAKDKLAISKADVVIINGGGYDYFAEQIIEELGDKAPTVVKSFEGEGHSHESSENEHVWYDLDHMEEFVGEVGEALAKADLDNAKTYEENASKLAEEIADVTDSEDFKAAEKKLKGKSFMMTEPVPEALLDELGMEDGTPEGLSSAVEAGQEIPALVIKRAEDSLKQGKVQLFAFNSQTADAQTKKLYESAKKAGVPTVDVTETIPEGKTFVEWMKDNVAAIAKAVDAK